MKFLFDFFPVLIFVIIYKIYGAYPAITAIMVASVVQNGLFWLKNRRFEKMHIITLGLVIFLGGATLLFQNKTFFMWKPTAVNWLFALVFLGSQFIGKKPIIRRMMDSVIQAQPKVWFRLNMSWVIFFILVGLANLYVASFFFEAQTALTLAAGPDIDIEKCNSLLDGKLLELCNHAKNMEDTWVNFKFIGVLGVTLIFVIGQAIFLAKYATIKNKDDKTDDDSAINDN